MSDNSIKPIGSVQWFDLTVEHAEQVRDFYREVVGWTVSDVDMGGYHDFCMNQPDDGTTVAGICHARGGNAGLPPQWLIYIVVADLDEAMARCVRMGGTVLAPARDYGAQGRYCVVRDPAGAAVALFESDDSAA